MGSLFGRCGAVLLVLLLLLSCFSATIGGVETGTHASLASRQPSAAAPAALLSPAPTGASPSAVAISPFLDPSPVRQVLADPANGTFLVLSVSQVRGSVTGGSVRAVSTTSLAVLARYKAPANLTPAIALDPGTGEVYLTNGSGVVAVLSGSTLGLVTAIKVPTLAKDLLYDPVNHEVYVAHACPPPGLSGTTTLTVIRTSSNTVVGSVPVPCDPVAMVADTDSGNVLLLTGAQGNLTVVSGGTPSVLATLPYVGGPRPPGASFPNEMLYDRTGGDLYLTCFTATYQSCIAVVNGTTGGLRGTVASTGTIVGPLALDPEGNILYLAAETGSGGRSQDLFVLSPRTLSATPAAHLTCYADALTRDPVNAALYAAGHCGTTASTPGTVFQFSALSHRLEATIPAVRHTLYQFGITKDTSAVDPVTGEVLVAFPATAGGSLVAPLGPFPMTFSATIAAPGVNWTTSVTSPSGYRESAYTETPSLTFWVPNGSYNFSITSSPGFWQSRSLGVLQIHGAPATVTVTFTWTWWGWSVVLFSAFALGPGWLAAWRARRRARHWHRLAAARLRWDLDHPLTGPPKEDASSRERRIR